MTKDKAQAALTIAQASTITGISIYTLRYYDKIGLLSFVERDTKGIRTFKPMDLLTLQIIQCLKDTGMPLNEIKRYLTLVDNGMDSVQERRHIFQERKEAVEREIKQLQAALDTIDEKIRYYDAVIEEGTLDTWQEEWAAKLSKLMKDHTERLAE
ncbi:MerR family transcriptional regulator [Bombiscardovia apis]|uniref:MerR family transcriptional regulator n=1 Tax=Bombiscardovia apis TaxID=2932182 RepID=A0ABM8BC74_9BIFI|nr:MerR family transcriptional regulator [Bombiscardovia apis]BDR54501.1 MerR family transcriptional regulator [Bombiscardovia apis]